MKHILFWLCIIFLMSSLDVHARDSLVFYQVGERDPVLWNALKRSFASKGYGVSVYEGATTLEKQIQNANKINKERAAIFLAIELVSSDIESTFVAMSSAKKKKGNVLEIDELPAAHIEDSEELAQAIATAYKRKIKKLPLFVLLGIDMPAVFLRIDCPKDRAADIFDRLHEGLQKYTRRGAQNEAERKGE